MKFPNRLLLLDLDGVLVHERDDQASGPKEILLLHKCLPEFLMGFSAPVMIVTHRSRAEARQVLDSIGVERRTLAGCVAAEDLLRTALTSGHLFAPMRRGLRKSLILRSLCRSLSLSPSQIAFVDDKRENVEDMLTVGIGLGLIAPFDPRRKDALKTFELDQLHDVFFHWACGNFEFAVASEPHRLNSVERNANFLPVTMRKDIPLSGKTFNFLRSAVRRSRKALNERPPR